MGTILIFLVTFKALAWKLTIIKSVSPSRRSFITPTGPESGAMVGREGTFTVDGVSVVAQAIKVDSDYTKWKLKAPYTLAPFRRDQMVTFNPSNEVVWLKVPSPSKTPGPPHTPPPHTPRPPTLKKGLQGSFHQGLGMSESISGVSSALEGERRQLQGEGDYFQEILPGISFHLGVRIDRESNQLQGFTISSSRQYLLLGGHFYLDQVLLGKLLIPYAGVTLGVGHSVTKVSGHTQKGLSFLLPHVRIGGRFPLSPHWGLNIEWGLESIHSQEKLKSGQKQKTTQTNGKVGVGFRYLF